MNIPHFKSLHAKQPGTISLDKVVDLIKNDTGIKRSSYLVGMHIGFRKRNPSVSTLHR